MDTCKQCEARETGYHSATLCGRCYVQSLVDDGLVKTAYEASVVEGLYLAEVHAMVRVARVRAERHEVSCKLRSAIAELQRNLSWSEIDQNPPTEWSHS